LAYSEKVFGWLTVGYEAVTKKAATKKAATNCGLVSIWIGAVAVDDRRQSTLECRLD
jgi:hypothetical protein